MIHKHLNYYIEHIKQDIPAGIVVFLVALPLCLGIAMASGAPLFAGVIAGMIGGILVSWCSGSQLSVSGPAAGLTVIVFNAIEQLGSYSGFLLCVFLAGVLQLILGFLRAGIIGAFFPSSVIKGMLAAIGIILIIKQIPHAVGYDVSFEGDESYMHETAASSFQELISSFSALSPGATLISTVALAILFVWELSWMKRFMLVRLIPGPLIAVAWGIAYNIVALNYYPEWAVTGKHLVTLPVTADVEQFVQLFQLPDFSFFANPQVYVIAATLAIIASLETLLSLEAVDKLDPLKRTAPTNRELKAQGLGNMISGLVGGLPITAVIVRSSANINAGGRTRIASFIHGILLLLSVMYLTQFLNLIPLACLSAILLQTGYKLATPKLFREVFRQGWGQFLPFVVTVIAILISDLLQGIIIGIVVGLYFVIRAHYHASITLHQEGSHYSLSLNKDVSFLNKPLLRRQLLQIDENSTVTIDASKAQFIDHDIMETLQDFLKTAPDDNIVVETVEMKSL
ncbi:SulP family inorganic anion transporter [Methylomarinum sp. Ch1-1]|uniref:SulP family inorganic anion transporter n=1 Tax=Methylomarinum roseum TaxID=3067653 RepID=A0AAU7P017_9GAMM|nr:SulP family inorganic anion transporter [Methylomarinum sp. Ch1-1]MDP4521752.1 SulP family inorganic anion transporter [Methylomarinum sp. Ch1-1]